MTPPDPATPSPREERCRECAHRPHLGLCQGRSGTTAYRCLCWAQTPNAPPAAAKAGAPAPANPPATSSNLAAKAGAQGEERWSVEQLTAACRNIGYDLTCGECASVFFTGAGAGAKHTCSPSPSRERASVRDIAQAVHEALCNRGLYVVPRASVRGPVERHDPRPYIEDVIDAELRKGHSPSRERAEALEEALRWYAEKYGALQGNGAMGWLVAVDEIRKDAGERARRALSAGRERDAGGGA